MSRPVVHLLHPSAREWQQGAEVPPRVNWWHVLGLGLLLLSAAITFGAIVVIWWLLA